MTELEKPSRPAKPPLPKPLQWILRITGAVALLLFLTPTAYVLKYCFWDSPRESRIASRWLARQNDPALLPALASTDPDTVALAEQTASKNPDARVRLAAIKSLGNILEVKGMAYQRPMESLTAKAALGQAAVHDADPKVRAEASNIIGKIAAAGAVLRR